MNVFTSTEPRDTKGGRTRRRIVEVAVRLFERQGYAKTTMRDIARAAECAPSLAYRYFARKEELVLELYANLADAFADRAQELPRGTIADRFRAAMRVKLEICAPHRETLGALFAAMLDPRHELGVLGERTAAVRARVTGVFAAVVKGAIDHPRAPHDARLARALYAAHLLIALLWIQDRSAGQAGTARAIELAGELIAFATPLVAFPPGRAALARLDAAIAAVLSPDQEHAP